MCVQGAQEHRHLRRHGLGQDDARSTSSARFIPEDERIVTIEDAAELQLPQDHLVQLETRPPNLEGKGAITIRDLVKNCLRMRPDRIVVGECRGGETLDMLQAMNTGHDGSLTTLHANTPRDAHRAARDDGADGRHGAAGEGHPRADRQRRAHHRAADALLRRHAEDLLHHRGRPAWRSTSSPCRTSSITSRKASRTTARSAAASWPRGFVPKFYDDLQRSGIPVNMSIFRED